MDTQFLSGLFCFLFIYTERVLDMHIHESVLSFPKDQFRCQNVCLLIHIYTHVCFERSLIWVDRHVVSDSLQIYPSFPQLLLIKSYTYTLVAKWIHYTLEYTWR